MQGRPQHASVPVPSGSAENKVLRRTPFFPLHQRLKNSLKVSLQVCFQFPGTIGSQTWLQGLVLKTLTASLSREN